MKTEDARDQTHASNIYCHHQSQDTRLPSLESDDGHDEGCKRLVRAFLGNCYQGFHWRERGDPVQKRQ